MNYEQKTMINIQSLSRTFGEKKALDNVSLKINKGQVFGIVGENGAGKTTLIKHILGLYKAQQGSVSVFAYDPVLHPEKVLAKIGYLSEQPDYPDWMTIAQFLNYMSAFYEDWDHQYAEELVNLFLLDKKMKIRELSKGQTARVGLCVAQAHKPDLLLLDEPSSGLDPIIRKDILTAIIRTVADEGRTVILSSHLLEEVERVCDHLLMFSHGKMLLSGSMEHILQNHHHINIRTEHKLQWNEFPEIFKHHEAFGEWQLHSYGDMDQLLPKLKQHGIEIIEHRAMTLNDIFMARCADKKQLQEGLS